MQWIACILDLNHRDGARNVDYIIYIIRVKVLESFNESHNIGIFHHYSKVTAGAAVILITSLYDHSGVIINRTKSGYR